MTAALALGAIFGLGLAAVAVGLRAGTAAVTGPGWRWVGSRAGLAGIVGALAFVATGWPVAAVAGAAFGAVVPTLVAGRAVERERVATALAVAAWTEMLRDTRGVGVGLGQAIAASAQVAPDAIAPAVEALAARCTRQRAEVALAAFAAEVDDRTADLVVCALVANERRSGSLEPVLTALAALARDEAALGQRIDAARASVQTSVRIVSGITVCLLVGMVVANRGFLTPYDSAVGQLVLAVVASMFALSFTWLARLRRVEAPERFLAPVAPTARAQR